MLIGGSAESSEGGCAGPTNECKMLARSHHEIPGTSSSSVNMEYMPCSHKELEARCFE